MKQIIKNMIIAGAVISGSLSMSAVVLAGEPETVSVAGVQVYTEMTSFGKEAERIIIEVNDTSSLMEYQEEDFYIDGCVTDRIHSNNLTGFHPENVFFTKTEVILEVDSFLIENSSHSFSITCTNEALNLAFEDITEIICPELAVFTDETAVAEDTSIQYKLFRPEIEENKKVPVVIYNHGAGCRQFDNVLTDDCFACSWVTEESQSYMPCYVIAPFRASNHDETIDPEKEMQALKAAIDQLIQEESADADRIYMTGESQGSFYTMTFANAYPGYLASMVLMNGGPMDIPENMTLDEALSMDLESPWSNAELETLVQSGTSVMFVQGIGDTLSVPVRYAAVYKKLIELGMEPGADLSWNSYTGDEFNLLLKGNTKIRYKTSEDNPIVFDPITGKTCYQDGSYHNTSRAAGWDTAVKRWLCVQTRNESGSAGIEYNRMCE